MTALLLKNPPFKRALILSAAAHVALFVLMITSPKLPKSGKREMVHYVTFNFGPPGGGGGGRGGGAKAPAAKKETLRDLTVPQKLETTPQSNLRHPVEKPRKETKPKEEKKAVISKPEPKIPAEETVAGESSGTGTAGTAGSGLRIGVGEGFGPGGPGGGYASQIGLSDFPFTYYLQILTDRVSASWFTSLIDPGVSGNFQCVVYFKIFRSGQVSDLKIEASSGIRSLDLSALRAIQSAAPFPPLPAEYENESLIVHLIFEHSR